MRFRLEGKAARCAPAPHFLVAVSARSDRHRRLRQIGQREEGGFALMLDRIELNPELLDLLRPVAIGFLDRRRILALAFGARDLVAGGVLLALQSLELGNDAAPGRLEGRDILERFVLIESAVEQTCAHRFDVIAHVRRVEHVASGLIVYSPARGLSATIQR